MAPPTRPLEPDWDFDSLVIHNSGHGDINSIAKIQNFDLTTRI